MSHNKDIVVIGASAGGVQALQELVRGLPPDFQASVFIVLHLSASAPSRLAEILQRQTELQVAQAEDGETFRRGRVYVARPDYHLVLEQETMHLSRGPRENRHRPSIDALFRSAAYAHAGRVIGVILTGELDDGTAGLWAVKQRKGTAIVQDPDDSESPSMPRSALQYVEAEHVVPLGSIAPLLHVLSQETESASAPPPETELEVETKIAMEGRGLQAGVMELGPITPYTCPECSGVLLQMKGGGVPRFRCHTGHAYSINNLLAEVTQHVEYSLWNSIRSIEESVMLLNHLSRHVRTLGWDSELIELCEQKAADTQRRADTIRQAAMEHQTLSQDNIVEVKAASR